MASAMEELDSAICLVQVAAEELSQKNPNHELLRFAKNFDNWAIPQEFHGLFGGDHIPKSERGTENACTYMYLNYINAIKKALGE